MKAILNMLSSFRLNLFWIVWDSPKSNNWNQIIKPNIKIIAEVVDGSWILVKIDMAYNWTKAPKKRAQKLKNI